LGDGGFYPWSDGFEVEATMPKRLLKETLIILGGTLFFLILCATVGISLNTRNTAPIVAAEEQKYDLGDQGFGQPPIWIRRYPHRGDE
jgi:hypothetical protein